MERERRKGRGEIERKREKERERYGEVRKNKNACGTQRGRLLQRYEAMNNQDMRYTLRIRVVWSSPAPGTTLTHHIERDVENLQN